MVKTRSSFFDQVGEFYLEQSFVVISLLKLERQTTIILNIHGKCTTKQWDNLKLKLQISTQFGFWVGIFKVKNSIENPKGSMEKFKVGGEITLIFMLFQTVFCIYPTLLVLSLFTLEKFHFTEKYPIKSRQQCLVPLRPSPSCFIPFFVQLYWNYPVEKLPVVNRGLLLQKHSFRICIQIQVPILDLSSTPVDFQTRLITLQELTDELVIWRNKKDIELFVAIHMLLLKFGCQ